MEEFSSWIQICSIGLTIIVGLSVIFRILFKRDRTSIDPIIITEKDFKKIAKAIAFIIVIIIIILEI